MALVNVIPEVSTYATAVPGSDGQARLGAGAGWQRRQGDCRCLSFPAFEGTPSVAMADVNGDMILDLIVGTGPGVSSEVVVYSGDDMGPGRFRRELARFAPFDLTSRAG